MEKPKGQPVVGDPKWIAYNKFKGTPKERLKRKEADELVARLCELFGGHVVNESYGSNERQDFPEGQRGRDEKADGGLEGVPKP